MAKAIVPIDPELYYTLEASYQGGGRFGIERNVLGKDLAKAKRDFRARAGEDERLRYSITLEGSGPRQLSQFAPPTRGQFLPDSAGVTHLFKRRMPTPEEAEFSRLRLEREVALRHAEYYEREAQKIGSDGTKTKALAKLRAQVEAWRWKADDIAKALPAAERAAIGPPDRRR